ncbi:lytic transglycosylase domain-containing protein [Sneathiella aquimaris]|uniref:lytic transglycosylase domain-containing protein n=1 Tax=Sneathiella aquimaris TaxID=2599305 RepID=UPI00146A9C55|nr:lytic transglycosylase domain-containing protein [Sneathiella aquimaris]
MNLTFSKRLILIGLLILISFSALPGKVNADTIPTILSDKDAGLYQQIFREQEEGNWKKADKLIRKIEDPLLMGHVKQQRYMHPTHYRASYPELHLWLKQYADHPGADKLYRLAVSRHLSDWKATPKPKTGQYLGGTGPGQPFYLSRSYKSKRSRSTKTVTEVKHAHRVVRRYLYRGQPTKAIEYLEQKKIQKLLDKTEYAILQAQIAKSFFLYAKDDLALEHAEAALQKSRRYVPLAHWTAGLTAWRLGKMKKAARHFTALSDVKRISGWTASRSSWWASRSFLKLGEAEKAIEYLQKAATYPRTFYGLLALRQLGVYKPFDWDLPKLTAANIEKLLKLPAAKRAIALSEAGQFHLAERELRSSFSKLRSKDGNLLLTLSERIGVPAVAMRMGLYLWERKDTAIDAAIYPLPQWIPQGGFKVDRALIYAFMRQESGFYSRAESPVGAKGLMQLMPSTASYLAGDKSLRNRKNRKLFNPSYNLKLGQKYLTYLMQDKTVQTNLFHLTIAYNGGPGNLIKWKSRTKANGDPLFFIEAMQSRETRSFIKRVLTNFWIYRHRLGQDLPALDDIAQGRWPQYRSLDKKNRKVADNARN